MMVQMNFLRSYSTSELCEIYENLNHWNWDERVGEKPCDWDDIPYTYHGMRKQRRTKYKVISPFLKNIKHIVGEKEILRYHNVQYLRSMNNNEFEEWYKSYAS